MTVRQSGRGGGLSRRLPAAGRRRGARVDLWLVSACLAGCTAVGLLAASPLVLLAAALVGGALLVGMVVFERRRVVTWLWAGVAFTAPMQGVRLAPALALSDVLIVLALLVTLPDVTRGWRRVVPGPMIMAFGVIVAAGLVGTFFTASTGASLGVLVKIVLAAPGSVIAIVLWGPSPAEVRRFAWLWFSGAVASAAWAVITPRGLFAGRAAGLTTHPNHFGLVCVLAVGLGLGLASTSRAQARTATFASVLLLSVGVGLSGSRSAFVALVVTIAAAAVLSHRFRLLVAVGVIVLLAGMAVVAGIVHIPESNALSRLAGGGGAAASNAERGRVRDAALDTIDRHPLTGEGFAEALAAHSIYLQALVVGGPLALAGFLGVSGLILRAGLVARRGRARRDGLLAGLTAGYAGYLSSGVFDNILWDRYLWTYIGILLVIAASIRNQAAGDGADDPPGREQTTPLGARPLGGAPPGGPQDPGHRLADAHRR